MYTLLHKQGSAVYKPHLQIYYKPLYTSNNPTQSHEFAFILYTNCVYMPLLASTGYIINKASSTIMCDFK